MITILRKLKKGRLLNMKDMGIIQGSAEQAVPLIIGKDTVYVHTDIEQVFKDNEGKSVDNLFRFHEIQYEKDEYIKKLSEENTNLMLASAETYETMYQENTNLMLAIAEVYESMNGGVV